MSGKPIRKTSRSPNKWFEGQHRFEHWLVDNQVYFITARCRDRYPAFASRQARDVFWDRFDHWTNHHGFTPWITSLIPNHYHTLGYLRVGAELPKLMQHLHGSVAKLVNDTLPERRENFWRDQAGKEYFDGCIRNEIQARRTYRYIQHQARRHKLCEDWQNYPDTRINVKLEPAIRRSHQLQAFMPDVPYKRYFRTC